MIDKYKLLEWIAHRRGWIDRCGSEGEIKRKDCAYALTTLKELEEFVREGFLDKGRFDS